MAAVPPIARPEPATARIYSGGPVSSPDTWSQLANLANWSRACGACLVPSYNPARTILSAATEVFRFRVKTRNVAVQRVWLVSLRTTATSPTNVDIKAPASTGTVQTVAASRNHERLSPVVYVETLSAKSTAESEINIEIKPISQSVVVESIMCFEMPRAVLTQDSTDYGVDLETVRPRSPIWEVANVSAEGVYNALANLDARRVGIFHWSVPEGGALVRSSGTPLDVLALATPVQAPKINSASTFSVKWSAYAKMAGGGTGTVYVSTSNSGVADNVSITSATFAWTTSRSVSIGADNFADADGRYSSVWDSLQFQWSGDGSNNCSLAALSVWVDDVA